jgi:DNA-binding NarL/FixJ family response regulator
MKRFEHEDLAATTYLHGLEPRVTVVSDDEVRGRRLLLTLTRAGLHSNVLVRHIDELREPGASGADVIAFCCDVVRFDGTDALRRLRDHTDARLVLVAPAAEQVDVREAFAAGADGLVLESALEITLGPAIVAVSSDQLVIPRTGRAHVSGPVLSPREKQVLALVVMGFTNAEIARKLHVAETTVKSHLSSTFRKLGVRSRSQAAARILDPDDGFGVGILSITDTGESLDVIDAS